MEDVTFNIDDIYVPVKRRKTLDEKTVEAIAESMMEEGQRTAIRVREGRGRYVLVEGLHRLEAARALGETTIRGLLVHAHRG
jgi:ParB-like chromosome segregation protein Spo0J